MTTFSQLVTGDTISFETIAPSILNLLYSQVKFEGMVTYKVAQSFGDIASLHRALYPSMDQTEVVDDYRSYDYLSYSATSGPKAGIIQVLGLPWIREETLTVSGNENLSIVFPSISPDNKDYLFMLLRANGFSDFQVIGND